MTDVAATIIEAPARRHRWGDPYTVLGDKTESGCEETERKCLLCGMVKITVHPPSHFGFPYRAWRTRLGMRAVLEHAPPCLEEVS